MTNETNDPVERNALTRISELRAEIDDLDLELTALGDRPHLDEAEELRWDELKANRDVVAPELAKLEARAAYKEELKNKKHRELAGVPEFIKPAEDLLNRAGGMDAINHSEARSGALRLLEDRDVQRSLAPHQLDAIEAQIGAEDRIAKRILVTENDDYRSMFQKRLLNANAGLSTAENNALMRWEEFRAQSETVGSGGYAIPVFIDPSLILTNQETYNPFLTLARQEDINTNAWKGVSSAGVSWSFDQEAAEVSDDSLTSIVQPTVSIFTARGFIPFSIEISEDWPGFQNEMARVLMAGYDELLVSKFSTGSGTNEPMGILTALGTASPTVLVTSTTDGAFGQEDVYATWSALPQKYQRNASWMMNVDIMNKVRQFGSSNVYHAYTVSLPAGSVEQLFARPVYQNPYFPVFSSTTGASNRLVVGDWNNYLVARRTGINVELVPQLFATANNLPSGQRGWFAYARIGGGVINSTAFRLQANT
jgi:HK97 family phage major capsid protein